MADYIDNKTFKEVLIKWKESGKEQFDNETAHYFVLLVENYVNHRWFRGYPSHIKEDMKSEALYYMIRYGKNFDPSRAEPFGYFTQIAKNAFLSVIQKEYKEQAKATEYFLNNTDNLDSTDTYNELLVDNNEKYKQSQEKKKKSKKKKSKKSTLFNGDVNE